MAPQRVVPATRLRRRLRRASVPVRRSFSEGWNAGTHNHHRLLAQKPLAILPKREAAAYGSRLALRLAGTTKMESEAVVPAHAGTHAP